MYVDESGDTGLVKSPSTHFALSSLVVHESRWRELIQLLIAFRKTLREAYGLPLRMEIHAAEFIGLRRFLEWRNIFALLYSVIFSMSWPR